MVKLYNCIQLVSYSVQPQSPRVPSDVELMGGQGVHERAHQVVCGEVEDEPKRDGDGKGGQRFLEHREQQEGQTQTLQDTKGRGAVSDGLGPGIRSLSRTCWTVALDAHHLPRSFQQLREGPESQSSHPRPNALHVNG